MDTSAAPSVYPDFGTEQHHRDCTCDRCRPPQPRPKRKPRRKQQQPPLEGLRCKPGSGLQSLADLSPQDLTWDSHRGWADSMADALRAADRPKEAARVRDCSEALFFHLRPDMLTGEVLVRLQSAPFCHWRNCPICGWRRSLRTKAILLQRLPDIMSQYPTARWIFLTLTVRNCRVSDLRETIAAMNQGWKRLIKRKDWPALGWLRSVEVTRGADGSAHPHFHALLLVPSGYFGGRSYVPTKEWVKRWRDAARLDYDPVCDVRVIKPKAAAAAPQAAAAAPQAAAAAGQAPDLGRALRAAVSETAKYQTKSADLLSAGPEWLATYVDQVHGTKITTSGGVLKGILKAMDQETDADLVHVDGEPEPGAEEAPERLVFHWRRKHRQYRRKLTQ